jgi:hypothetical protein
VTDDAPGGDDAEDRLVALLYAPSPFEADTIVALLEAHDIPAYAAHRHLEDVFPALFSHDGTAVMVREADLARAEELLASEPRP